MYVGVSVRRGVAVKVCVVVHVCVAARVCVRDAVGVRVRLTVVVRVAEKETDPEWDGVALPALAVAVHPGLRV